METKATIQGIVVLSDKKKWENPTLIVIDQGNVNGGPVNAVHENTSAGFVTPLNTHGYTPTNHS
jgi:hypothetical protein